MRLGRRRRDEISRLERDGKLTFEFTGEPDQKPTNDHFESYERDDKIGKDASYGTFTASPGSAVGDDPVEAQLNPWI